MKKILKISFTLITVVLLSMVAVFGVSALEVGTVSSVKTTKTKTSISISWTKAKNAVGYRIYERKDGKWKTVGNTTKTTFKINELKSGTKHTFAIKAYGKEKNKTVWAKEFRTVTTGTRPVTVKTLKASVSDTSAKLTWSKAAGATGYRLYKYNSSKKSWDVILKSTSATTVTVKKLKSGTKYTFAVKPYFKAGSETVWASAHTQLKICTKPAATSKLTAKAAKKSVALSWNKVTGATGYRLYKYNTSKKSWDVILKSTSSTSVTVKGLKTGTKYIFAVKPYLKFNGKTVWASNYKKVTVTTKAAQKVKLIDINLTQDEYAIGVDKNQPELLKKTNDFIAKIKKDGTLDKICNNYFGNGTPVGVKSAVLDPRKDQLVVATNACFEPFEYVWGDTYYGIDMEIAALLAKELGKELVINNMDFDAVCLSVGLHESDIVITGITVLDARKKYVNFTKPYYDASQKLIVKADDTTFDTCKNANDVEKILKRFDETKKIGVQCCTIGYFYVRGDPDWGFGRDPDLKAECVKYDYIYNAATHLYQGKLNCIVTDASSADAIVRKINK